MDVNKFGIFFRYVINFCFLIYLLTKFFNGKLKKMGMKKIKLAMLTTHESVNRNCKVGI